MAKSFLKFLLFPFSYVSGRTESVSKQPIRRTQLIIAVEIRHNAL
jgi:hypothetical protein